MTEAKPTQVLATRRAAVQFLLVVLGCFVVFNLNGRELGLADTIPATLLPASLVRDGDLVLDEFEPLFQEKSPDGFSTLAKQIEWTMAVRRVKGALRSSYPVGGAVLAAPIYAVPSALGWLHSFDDYRFAGKVSASLLTALSAGFLFLVLLRFCSPLTAVLLTSTYAFGTTVWVIASQAMWQHGPALLCLAMATWAAVRTDEKGLARDAALVSASAAFAIVCRPQDALAAVPIALFALARRPRLAVALVIPGLVVLAGQVAYNLRAFGSVGGGYADLYQAPAHAFRHLDAKSAFTLPLHEGLSGLLLSPGKGLLVYSPVLAVALVALPVLAASRQSPLSWVLLAWVGASLILHSKNRLWWGGTSYGPRYLTELAFPLVLALGMSWPRLGARLPWAIAMGVLAALGVLVQALGAFTWECGWHLWPAWIDFRPDRVWDFRDPEILRCAESFVKHGPKPPGMAPFAR